MDGAIGRKSVVSRWWLMLMVGLGVLPAVIGLWCYRRDHDARQRAQATEREGRLAVLRAEAEADRIQNERQMARVKSAARVEELYREIGNLNHVGDQVQTSLQPRPRMLKNSEPQSRSTPESRIPRS
jgi:hypothetical protein